MSKCKKCNCEVFISSPNKYDIFEVQGNKIVYRKTEIIKNNLSLFCRDCSEKINFDIEDVIFDTCYETILKVH